ncbi:MAG: VOC family protein [Chthoniobacteraceae bacterium]
MSTNYLPAGYPICAPYLIITDAARALDFYATAFGATERMRMQMPDGKVGHAEIEIAGGIIMIADEFPQMGCRSPKTIGGSPVTIHLYVPDVDALTARAGAAGATLDQPPENQFYGDRTARVTDPFGHVWHFATHVEDVTPEEMERRSREKFGGG